MPTTYESSNPLLDAPAGLDTDYCFMPHPDGSFDKDNNTFTGTFSHSMDEDWVIIELKAGQAYTITVEGHKREGPMDRDEAHKYNPAKDVVLMLLDSKGGQY